MSDIAVPLRLFLKALSPEDLAALAREVYCENSERMAKDFPYMVTVLPQGVVLTPVECGHLHDYLPNPYPGHASLALFIKSYRARTGASLLGMRDMVKEIRVRYLTKYGDSD